MQFRIGDRVVHPMYGVGTVKSWTEQEFGGGQMREYYEVETDSATVWVPIDGQGATVLRGIASRHSLAECRRLLSSAPVPLDRSQKLRQIEIGSRLKGGLLPALCETVRDLRAFNSGATLPPSDERVLRRIYKALCEEWAASEGVSEQAALHEIEDLLLESHAAQVAVKGLGN
ncbi:MAG TPA: CarD family transcriptional regulator [Anaerolineae bacterium]